MGTFHAAEIRVAGFRAGGGGAAQPPGGTASLGLRVPWRLGLPS